MTKPDPASLARTTVDWSRRSRSKVALSKVALSKVALSKVALRHPGRADEARRASLPVGRHIVRCRPVDITGAVGRFSIAVELPGRISQDIASTGTFEPHVAWAAACLTRPGTVMVDAGADIGFHSLNVAASRPDVSVHAFEPVPRIAASLRANAALNPVLTNLTVYEVVLGSDAGARIDDLFADDNLGLIKLGVGAPGPAVLEGAVDTLGRCRPVVITEFVGEYTTDPRADLDRLRSFMPNYDLYCLRPSDRHDNDHLGPELGPFEPGMVDDPAFRADLLCLPSDRFS